MQQHVSKSHPAEESLRRAVETLVTGSGRIRERLQAAELHVRGISRDQMRGQVERDLDLRIGAGLVEGGDDEDADDTAAIAMLDESRAAEIAGDILRLYEVVTHVHDDDGP